MDLLKLFSLILPLTAISNVIGRQWMMVVKKDKFYAIAQVIASIMGLISFIFFLEDYQISSIPISIIFFELSSIIMILSFLIFNANRQYFKT